MSDPKPTFAYMTQQLKECHPDLAYLHVVEPRISGSEDESNSVDSTESNDFIREIWSPRPLISAGGYICQTAFKTADEKGDLIAFGRYYISNVGVFVGRRIVTDHLCSLICRLGS